MTYEDSRIRDVMMREPAESIAFENCPDLESRHVEGARLYANRHDMIRALDIPSGGTIAELGVALGDFSAFLIDTLKPHAFVACDIFTMHETPFFWGKPSSEWFHGKTQLDSYCDRFASFPGLTVEVGNSYETLAAYPDGFFDLIYIDAGHDYVSVCRDAEVSAAKVKAGGVLVFNDYTMMDPINHGPYGVVPAVNQIVAAGGWHVVGLALQRHMFCDLAVRKA